MNPNTQAESRRKMWSQVARASQALNQAGALIKEAQLLLDRFCSARDQDNWDQAFAWRISELAQAQALCDEVAAHLDGRSAEASDPGQPGPVKPKA